MPHLRGPVRQAGAGQRGGGGRGPRPAAPVPSFSLAHSGDAVVIAVAGQPVGVDVEREATGCVCSLVTAMHPGDAAIVEPLPEPERHAAIIRWWVRAEAVLKCAGTGIGHGLDAFPVLGGPGGARVPAGVRLGRPGARSPRCPRPRATRRRSPFPGSG